MEELATSFNDKCKNLRLLQLPGAFDWNRISDPALAELVAKMRALESKFDWGDHGTRCVEIQFLDHDRSRFNHFQGTPQILSDSGVAGGHDDVACEAPELGQRLEHTESIIRVQDVDFVNTNLFGNQAKAVNGVGNGVTRDPEHVIVKPLEISRDLGRKTRRAHATRSRNETYTGVRQFFPDLGHFLFSPHEMRRKRPNQCADVCEMEFGM
ncbi:hypothetical protein HK102_006940 [Quaeritorhiza haematococci]|nr:hypothetical protein HK102_006940 [Quaeritorhiza haematococci]